MPASEDFDFGDKPSALKRDLLEADVQESCVKWARGRGWYARKFSSPQNRAVVDYVFGKDTWVEWVEFKKPKGKRPAGQLSEDQAEEHKKMRECGMTPVVFDDVAAFKRYILKAEFEMSQRAGLCAVSWDEWVGSREALAVGHERGDDV
jgi:hypothetical protein